MGLRIGIKDDFSTSAMNSLGGEGGSGGLSKCDARERGGRNCGKDVGFTNSMKPLRRYVLKADRFRLAFVRR